MGTDFNQQVTENPSGGSKTTHFKILGHFKSCKK